MISTDITGNSGGEASQVFSLLAVVADPAAYGEKLKALVQATEEHKKYLALIGPASEILEIRAQINADRDAAKQALETARMEAQQIKDTASEDAKRIVEDAKEVIEQAKKAATEAQAVATSKIAGMERLVVDLSNRVNAAKNAEKLAIQEQQAAATARAAADSEMQAAVSLKQKLVAKAKSFMEDLTK